MECKVWAYFHLLKDEAKWWSCVITVTNDNVLQKLEIY
jgi:hypothetical protein